jgi:hypothetical protein
LEAYDEYFGVEDHHKLVQQYSGAGGKTLAMANWTLNDNTTVMKPCEVLSCHGDSFMIKWVESGNKKQLPRLSLCFDGECRSKWDARVHKAKIMREKAELLLEYFVLV